MSNPKILFVDIETAPLVAYTWGLFDQNIGLNQIHTDWHLLSWSAKWAGYKEVLYQDQRNSKDKTDDKELARGIWHLLDEADIIVTQNGKEFDAKKLNARFIQHGFDPPSPYKHIDTLKIARKYFGFTSNKLAYMTDKLCTKYKKLVNHKFEGFELWKQCLAGNLKAWKEMEKYNKHDVLSLEELYNKLIKWDSATTFHVFDKNCTCSKPKLQRRGYMTTTLGKYQRFQCTSCGKWSRGPTNFNKGKKLNRGIS